MAIELDTGSYGRMGTAYCDNNGENINMWYGVGSRVG